MSQPVKDSFLDLEKHRQLLEENIENLRNSLRHWQTWEAEYEGLKEEILSSGSALSEEEWSAIAQDYEGELVTKKEIGDILGVKPRRTAAQVVNLLDRRIDYVEQNVKTVQKQIKLAENKLMAATVISTPDVRNEEGLPLTDIIEELDDDGNVLSSHTTTPGSARPQLLEVLRKAGVKDLPEMDPKFENTVSPASVKETAENGIQDAKATELQNTKEPPVPVQKKAQTPPALEKAAKNVKFATDTKPGPELRTSKTAKRIKEVVDLANQASTKSLGPPIIPTDESPEDAALRRQMLQYTMSEVGSVVAELELEEGSDWSDAEDGEDGTSSTDDEDEHGRSTGRIVDDELRQRMIELEEQLGVRLMENIGKKASDYDVVQEGIGRVSIKPEDKGLESDENLEGSAKMKGDSQKKSVHFSHELGVEPTAALPATKPQPAGEQKMRIAPVSDIIERAPAPNTSPVTASRKVSRFKTAHKATTLKSGNSEPPQAPSSVPYLPTFTATMDPTYTAPTGPAGRTLAPTIVEHAVALNPFAAEPDELDPQLLQQEVAVEYHKMRNRMIARQGGFMKEEESEIVPFTEEEGGPKKLSRFKAARLARV